jgi:DNA mismatch endonuclease (patch repair protein)
LQSLWSRTSSRSLKSRLGREWSQSRSVADVVTPEKRSQMMAGIRGKNTTPELLIRRGLHRRGFRFRLHRKDLPGNPDLVFPRHRAVIFAQGCFWHGHACHLFKWPKSRSEFWCDKIEQNRERDRLAHERLEAAGWRIAQVWECALKGRQRLDADEMMDRIESWLRSYEPSLEISGR